MSIFKKTFWDNHEIMKTEETPAEVLNDTERKILREFSKLKKAPPKYKASTKKGKNRMGRMYDTKLTEAEIAFYSDDSDYDDDDVKKQLIPGQNVIIIARQQYGADDDDAAADDSDDDAAANNDNDDVADNGRVAIEAIDDSDDEDIDDGEDVPADDSDNDDDPPQDNVNAVKYDFWKIVARFTQGGQIRSDAQVNAIVAGLDAVTREKFITDYRAVYKRAHDTILADKMADRTKKPIRGIVNYMIYMGEEAYDNLRENLDDLQIALEYGDAFYPQVSF